MKTKILKHYLGAILFLLTTNVYVIGSTPTPSKIKRPNILFILMDDLGYADVGFMPNSAKDILTPNIDKLANQGTIFTSAYVAHPFCGPSRTSILTGKMPHTLGAQFNLAAFSGNGIDDTETFISDELQSSGYYTGAIGKWHLGEEEKYHPTSRGFDYFYGFLGGGHEYFSKSWVKSETYNPAIAKVGDYHYDYNRPMMENTTYVPTDKEQYVTDILTDAGLEFIEDASKKEAPFYLYLSYNAPHTPLQAQGKDIKQLQETLGEDAAANGSERLTYTAMMYNVDYNIKRVVEKLKSTGQFDNTLIIFLSDNGGKYTKGANNQPLKGKKGDAYEGGFRVPMFMHWPNGNVPKGEINSNNFSALDFYPTLAHLGGVEIPSSKIYDGVDAWEGIVNNKNSRNDKPIFVMRHQHNRNWTGVVQDNYKLHSLGNGKWALYDLCEDIGEENNIASLHPEIVTSMKEAVYQWTWTWEKHRPEFFDSPRYGFEESWNTSNMPNFGKTFGEIYDRKDYVSIPKKADL
ncbi:sulfatase [Flammeovirga pectinis]|uniref:Sulfatase n=1 Tax=Flammeovirga pectinis TaxID=2494373 RepID=A0A3Q9FRC5_9BACT|nr:sulfatase-like hydrolase/transferase [Flammeovirga pectinis]AZQ62751.1 sulfatase [Flammeovirga pectinis]